ncbi:unnamed protein product [Closterium sp. NIES-54]
MPAAEFVAFDDNQPTCAEPGKDPLGIEPDTEAATSSWEAPVDIVAVYEDANPATREARRLARATCEILIGYVKATNIIPRDLYALFDNRNPVIVERLERASPRLNLNVPPQSPCHDGPGRVLPDWMTRPSRCQELFDGRVIAVMDGYIDVAGWVRM